MPYDVKLIFRLKVIEFSGFNARARLPELKVMSGPLANFKSMVIEYQREAKIPCPTLREILAINSIVFANDTISIVENNRNIMSNCTNANNYKCTAK